MSNAVKQERPPLIGPGHTLGSVSDKIGGLVLRPGLSKSWLICFGVAFIVLNMLIVTITYLVMTGIGIWGNNIPTGWAFDIVNFVWWIGIGHAGTLISAILLLLGQTWRTSINRFAEAMTLFAVACAGLFPLLHTGRPWVAYFILPYPNTMALWPQWRSPLVWDVFAISTYGTVSLVFWYVGLVPDLATLRDRAGNVFSRTIYGIFALGWRGSARHWHRYQVASLILAGLATPLVLSVHTIVSFDFASSVIPGWHTTIFPPYFVAGAIYSGFAMVITIAIPMRKMFNLYDLITDRHMDNMAKVMLATGLLVGYGYLMEAFMGWYGGNKYEQYMFLMRLFGPYRWSYYALLSCNIIIPQLLWSRRYRLHMPTLFIMSFVVNVGMWLERFVIIPMSLTRDFMPSSWHMYYPTTWDWTMFIGTMGLFTTLLYLFVRFLPVISIFEVRELLDHQKHGAH